MNHIWLTESWII